MADPLKIEVVSHCWAYSRLLCLQASSLILHPPDPAKVSIVHTVFYSREDFETVAMLEWLRSQQWPAAVRWRHWPLETPSLLRRAIGRNLACKDTKADVIWLADADYLFGDGCLDSLADEWPKVTGPLAYPRYSIRSASDPAGDAEIARVVPEHCGPSLCDVDYAAGCGEITRRAIGGIQIYRGDVARERGYLPDTRWQRPADRWKRTFDDRAFRGWLGTPGESIELKNLYRVRHSQKGRDNPAARN